ncbi:MAG: hypothetical protein CL489_11405 [Acidobacteria bacterium]|nr:hypothetical protein [Acidobacteriota bacterium]
MISIDQAAQCIQGPAVCGDQLQAGVGVFQHGYLENPPVVMLRNSHSASWWRHGVGRCRPKDNGSAW